jgi:hypothetical protein
MWWMQFVQCVNFCWSASRLLCVTNILIHLLRWAWLKWKSTEKDRCFVPILNDVWRKCMAHCVTCLNCVLSVSQPLGWGTFSLGIWHSVTVLCLNTGKPVSCPRRTATTYELHLRNTQFISWVIYIFLYVLLKELILNVITCLACLVYRQPTLLLI